jgi:hypothetical protein
VAFAEARCMFRYFEFIMTKPAGATFARGGLVFESGAGGSE